MDLVTYVLAKKIAASAVSGISNLQVDEQNLIITTKDGNKLTMHFPSPTSLSLTNCQINDNNHLIFSFSDGNVVDCGVLPIVKGEDGETPYIDSETQHWFIGEQDTGITAAIVWAPL